MNYWLEQTERDRLCELAGVRPIEKLEKYDKAGYYMLEKVMPNLGKPVWAGKSIEEMEQNALGYLAKHLAKHRGQKPFDKYGSDYVTDYGFGLKSAEIERAQERGNHGF